MIYKINISISNIFQIKYKYIPRSLYNQFNQEICPNLRIPSKAPNSTRTHFSQKIIFEFSKKSLRSFSPESYVFPPEARIIPPEFIFSKNTEFQYFRLLKLNSAHNQIFCPTSPSNI